MAASTTVTFVPGMGATHAYLAGAALNLKPGDALLFAGEDVDVQPDHWDLRILTSVVADAVNERTRVEWDEGLGSAQWHVTPANPPQPFALRKRINVFGHNAPFKGLIDNPTHGQRLDVRTLLRGRAVRRPRRLASRRRPSARGSSSRSRPTASCSR